MTIYTAYLTADVAEWLTEHSDLLANGVNVTHTGQGIVTFGDTAMGFLEDFGDEEDGCITDDEQGLRMWVGGDAYPIITDRATDLDQLAETILALPKMPLVAREVTARRLSNVVAKSVLSRVADVAVVDLVALYRGRGGYRAVADLLGKTESAVNKAISDENERRLSNPASGR